MKQRHLRVVPTLEERLAESFTREDDLLVELAQVRRDISEDRLLWMRRERTFGISDEALRRAVRR